MPTRGILFLVLCLIGCCLNSAHAAAPANSATHGELTFPRSLDQYHDNDAPNRVQKLIARAKTDPVNVLGTIIFVCAIVHTFLTARFMRISHRYQKEFEDLEGQPKESSLSVERRRDFLQFWGQFFHFMGEVEAVFGIWLIPLFVTIVLTKGWPTLVGYITSLNAAEPVFVVVVMAVASSHPILRLAENSLAKLAALGRSTPGAW
jgi:hypothetical protein